MTLSELHEQWKDCTDCPLCEKRTHVVCGVGNPDADIMLIGEGPGEQEDLKNEPFVGRSGQLLTELLEEIGLERSDVYIANIVKCRPPNNRDPKPEEVKICSKKLEHQIELINPKLIVCVGRISAMLMIDASFKIMSMHGKLFKNKTNGRVYMATLHPAAVLRNMGNLPLSKDDFQIIKRINEKIGHS